MKTYAIKIWISLTSMNTVNLCPLHTTTNTNKNPEVAFPESCTLQSRTCFSLMKTSPNCRGSKFDFACHYQTQFCSIWLLKFLPLQFVSLELVIRSMVTLTKQITGLKIFGEASENVYTRHPFNKNLHTLKLVSVALTYSTWLSSKK